MTRRKRTSGNPFGIDDQPMSLHGWEQNAPGGLADVEKDVRELMKQLGQARFDLTEGQRRHDSEIRGMLLELLDVMDAFDRVFENVARRKSELVGRIKRWVSNFRAIHRILRKVLKQHDVVEFECLGQEFDPNWHEVHETVKDPSRPDGWIAEVVRKGYLWRGKLLREALTLVVKNSDSGRDSTGQSDGPPTEQEEEQTEDPDDRSDA